MDLQTEELAEAARQVVASLGGSPGNLIRSSRRVLNQPPIGLNGSRGN